MSLPFGTQVAIVDDKLEDVRGIVEFLDSQGVGFHKFDASPHKRNLPDSPIPSLNTIFLDLYYEEGVKTFDPTIPANWVDKLISSNQHYFLVIWSKDTQHNTELLQVLQTIEKTPFAHISAQKSNYHVGPDEYDIEKLFEEIELELLQVQKPEERIKGQIISVEDDHVLINCRLVQEKAMFQVRRFDKEPLEGVVPLVKNEFLEISIKTIPGKRTIEFFHLQGDYRNDFVQEDLFKGFENTAFNPKSNL